VDLDAPTGITNIDMPLTPAALWRAMQGNRFRTDLAGT
jgi:aerobic carbon-monoxide dehydrogenase large subunit